MAADGLPSGRLRVGRPDAVDDAPRIRRPPDPTRSVPARLGPRLRVAPPRANRRGRLGRPQGARRRSAFERLGSRITDPSLTEEQLRKLARDELSQVIDAEQVPLSPEERRRLIRDIGDEALGLGPLERLLDDPEISEIMVNRADQIYVGTQRQARADRRHLQLRGPAAPASSSASSRRSAAASTSPRRWWTPGSRTARASTPSSRRWRSTGRRITIRKFSHGSADGRRTSIELRHA